MFCSNCGSKLAEGANFCSVCGARVAASVDISQPVTKPEPVPEPVIEEPVIPQVIEPAVPEPVETVTPQKPETVVSETKMGSVEMPSSQPDTQVKTRLAFDWSNVKEEPRKRPIPNVKSPWAQTGSIEESEIFAEMTPSTDRSRTMNFIDVLRAEREAEEKEREEEARRGHREPKQYNIDYTEVLHLDLDNIDKPEEKKPKLNYAPLLDLDTPVESPFDESQQDEHAAAPESADVVEEQTAEPEKPEPAQQKPAWHWFEMPDFLRPKAETIRTAAEVPAAAAELAAETSVAATDTEYESAEPASEETAPVSPAPEETASEDALLEETVFEESEFEEYTDTEDTAIEDVTEEAPVEEAAISDNTAEEYNSYFEDAQEEPVVLEVPVAEPEALESEPEAEPEVIEVEPESESVTVQPEVLAETEVAAEDEYYEYLSMETGSSAEPSAEETVQIGDLEDDIASILAENDQRAPKHGSYDPEDFEDDESEDGDSEEVETVAEAAAEEKIDEEELFEEMGSHSGEKSGMTIAAPADKESEIEALKRRLAELTGAPVDIPDPTAETVVEAELQPESSEEAVEEVSIAEEVQPEILSLEELLAAEKEPEPEIQTEPEPVYDTEPDLDVYLAAEPEVQPEAEAVQAEPEMPAEPKSALEELISRDTAAFLKDGSKAVTVNTTAFEDQLASFLADAAETEPVSFADEGSFVASEPEVTQPDVSELYSSDDDDFFKINEEPMQAEEAPAELVETAESKEESAAVEIEEEIIAEPVLSADDLVEERTIAEDDLRVSPIIAPEPELTPAPEAEPENKPTDAMSLEDLEKDLFGESPSPDAEQMVTKNIDKFYTLYRKNKEFQQMLDEEYNKRKIDAEPSPDHAEIAAITGEIDEKPAKKIEDATIYQSQDENILKELKELQPEAAAAAVDTSVKSAPIDLDDAAADVGLSKKERKKAEKERKQAEKQAKKEAKNKAKEQEDTSDFEYDEPERGSAVLTVIAVIIAILLVFLLAVILVLNFAPGSSIALQIDSVIENITEHFSSSDITGGSFPL